MYCKVWDMVGCKWYRIRGGYSPAFSAGIVLISFLPHSWYRVVVWIQYENKVDSNN